ncbi:MAG: TIGR03067 domain-containing protein, partial [Blastocatellia bacterium]
MKRDMKNLQGTWNVVSLEMEGQKLAEGTLTGAKIVVEGSHFTSAGMGMTYEGKIEIDTSTTPKSFNLIFEAGPEKGNT